MLKNTRNIGTAITKIMSNCIIMFMGIQLMLKFVDTMIHVFADFDSINTGYMLIDLIVKLGCGFIIMVCISELEDVICRILSEIED